jgi:uracil-DNA glycosylase
MEKPLLARLEAWLAYYDDLNLGPMFIRRGAPGEGSWRSRAQALSPDAVKSLPTLAGQPLRSVHGAPARPVSPSAPHSEPAISISGGQSLFASTERIEGDSLERIQADIGECTRCKLHKSRHRIVFGDGNARADLVFVGEGPGEEEDRQGLPFVGRAGKLLTQMIEAMGLQREAVYICNVVKCRPPSNRTPERDETSTCQPFLERQLEVIRPKVIVCLGSVAAQALLGTGEAMARVRGKWFDWRGAKLLPTYHPAYLLRNPSAKAIVWDDLQLVMSELGLQRAKKPKSRL